jgi:hypothetical protein
MKNTPVIKLKGQIHTDYRGMKKLFDLYTQTSKFKNQTISIDFYELEWLDANLSSLLCAILYKLISENNLKFSTNMDYLEENFDILFRNGLFLKNQKQVYDDRNSTVVLKAFEAKSSKNFARYIKNNLLKHRGMPKFEKKTIQGILTEIIEVYNNFELHANTEYPCFVCGQYYPKTKQIKVTIVDIGIGFLPPINKKNPSIETDIDAIKWALKKRNTTRLDNTPGGLGLYQLNNYCKQNNSELQISTGNTFWSSELDKKTPNKKLYKNKHFGTTINLLISH